MRDLGPSWARFWNSWALGREASNTFRETSSSQRSPILLPVEVLIERDRKPFPVAAPDGWDDRPNTVPEQGSEGRASVACRIFKWHQPPSNRWINLLITRQQDHLLPSSASRPSSRWARSLCLRGLARPRRRSA